MCVSRYGNTKNTLRSAGSDVAKRINLQELPALSMPLGSGKEDRSSCWNLLFLVRLAGNSYSSYYSFSGSYTAD